MSRATRPRHVLAAPLREKLLTKLLYYRSLRRVRLVLRLPEHLIRRAIVGRSLRPWQARAVALSMRGGT